MICGDCMKGGKIKRVRYIFIQIRFKSGKWHK
jgi:hypothetical protein